MYANVNAPPTFGANAAPQPNVSPEFFPSAPSFPTYTAPCSATHAYERKIAKVEVESETRAIVNAVIKNVEPPEPGAEYDDAARKAKESGERFRYTLERQKATDGWRISSIEHFPSYARDWEEAYSKRKPSNNRYIYEQFQ